MSQLTKISVRGKVIDKNWFIRIGPLWGLQEASKRVPHPENLVGYSFIIKGKVRRGKDHFLPHSWVDVKFPSSVPPPVWAGESSCLCVVKPRLSWHYGKIISGLSTMRSFHFEMSPFYKLLFLCLCVPRACLELTGQNLGLTPPLFYCLRARLMLLLHGFIVRQVCWVLWLSKPAF